MERDDGTIDWDAAFEAVVAGLRPPRYQRAALRAGQVTVGLALMACAAWTLVSLVAQSLDGFGRPWL